MHKWLQGTIGCLCLLFFSLEASEPFTGIDEPTPEIFENEIQALKELITTNERRLQTQKQLQNLMIELKQQKEEFIAGNQTKSHAHTMVFQARQILGIIKQEHLSYLFSPEYLEELVFFSSIAGKSAPVRP